MGIDAQMFIRLQREVSDREVKLLAYELSASFGHDKFMIDRERKWDGDHCIKKIEAYTQDGPIIYPEEGETFLQVRLQSRYYGVDYERGDLPLLIMIAEYLKIKLPDCEIWYGGDSSGVLAELFNKKARWDLFKHFAEVNHSPYKEAFNVVGSGYQMCDFCNQPMNQSGWGENYEGFNCPGCGYRLEIRDGERKEIFNY